MFDYLRIMSSRLLSDSLQFLLEVYHAAQTLTLPLQEFSQTLSSSEKVVYSFGFEPQKCILHSLLYFSVVISDSLLVIADILQYLFRFVYRIHLSLLSYMLPNLPRSSLYPDLHCSVLYLLHLLSMIPLK